MSPKCNQREAEGQKDLVIHQIQESAGQVTFNSLRLILIFSLIKYSV